jgi:hypothetical protein
MTVTPSLLIEVYILPAGAERMYISLAPPEHETMINPVIAENKKRDRKYPEFEINLCI